MNSNINSISRENGINYQSEIKSNDNFLKSKRKSYISNNHKDLSQLSINKSLNNTEIRLERVNNALINTRISDIKSFHPSCNQSHISVKSFLKTNHSFLNDYTQIIKLLGGTICLFSISYFLYKNDYVRQCLNEVKDELILNKKEIIDGFAILASAIFILSVINQIRADKEWQNICKEISKETETFIMDYLSNDNKAYIEEDYIIILISTKYNLDQKIVLKEVYNCFLMPSMSNNINLAKKDIVEDGQIKSFWVKTFI